LTSGEFQSLLTLTVQAASEPAIQAAAEEADPGALVVRISVLCLALLAIAIIGYYAVIRGVRTTDPGTRWALMIAFVMLSPLVYFLNFGLAIQGSKPVEFCNSCHVMKPYVDDLENPESERLAAQHFQYRWISDHQCYTCHSDYGLFGGAEAKLAGLRHYVKYYLTGYERPIKIRGTYDNKRCLHCHGPVASYREIAEHQKNEAAIATSEMSCLGSSCHVKTHPDAEGAKHADAGS
jgi:cytochrome c nitrite reductase small subunit